MIDEFSQNIYGSRVKIASNKAGPKSGELLFVDKEHLVYLTNKNQPKSVSKDGIRSMTIYLTHAHTAKGGGSSTSIPWLVIGHGWWSAFTGPINAIVLGSLNKYSYKMRYPLDIEWEELNKFSRFPQGMPEHIDPESLTSPFRYIRPVRRL